MVVEAGMRQVIYPGRPVRESDVTNM